MIEQLVHRVFIGAILIGLLAGTGLVLTSRLSRRGPLAIPVYAAFLVILTVLLARDSTLSFWFRLGVAFSGFMVAGVIHYIATATAANRERRQRGSTDHVSLAGHAWRMSLLLAAGLIAAVGVAFIAAA